MLHHDEGIEIASRPEQTSGPPMNEQRRYEYGTVQYGQEPPHHPPYYIAHHHDLARGPLDHDAFLSCLLMGLASSSWSIAQTYSSPDRSGCRSSTRHGGTLTAGGMPHFMAGTALIESVLVLSIVLYDRTVPIVMQLECCVAVRRAFCAVKGCQEPRGGHPPQVPKNYSMLSEAFSRVGKHSVWSLATCEWQNSW